MGPVQYAIEEVMAQIPPEILQIVFNDQQRKHGFNRNKKSTEAVIREKIIEGRIRRMCDAAGSKQVDIPIDTSMFEHLDGNVWIVRVPKNVTQGRTITSALSINIGNTVSRGNQALEIGGSQLLNAAEGILNANGNIPVTGTARLSIVGENVIMVEDYLPTHNYMLMKVLVSSDTEFSHIKPQTYANFSKMVVLATKAYIYNNYIIELDKGYIHGGQSIDGIRNIIDEYRDANDVLEEFYNDKWFRIAHQNDQQRKQRTLRMILGNR